MLFWSHRHELADPVDVDLFERLHLLPDQLDCIIEDILYRLRCLLA